MLQILAAIILSYLIGSIPTAYIFGRLLKGIDIRKFGSGNVGTTNAIRLLGSGWGMVVFIIDILKGFLPVVFLGNYLISQNPTVSAVLLRIFLGLACILGHNWTVFLRFGGGKGVATGLGFLLALSFSVKGFVYVIILSIFIWILVFAFLRIVSLASIIASISLPAWAVILKQQPEIIILAFVLCLLSLLRHQPNIKRLLKGQEPSFKK
ncbi:MAG: glycerol-3-phosphate 1-O-acyltransferase PlsY [Candidatus Omnitrophica bacterium]|nr:glycerol-3-phosphate 1-O-acyltransferase PlsY [Candidatus Omnitrophota bacterium]